MQDALVIENDVPPPVFRWPANGSRECDTVTTWQPSATEALPVASGVAPDWTPRAWRHAAAIPDLPVLVLDFETFYDADYTLEKMSTPEYVLDDRFYVHGLAICYPGGRTEFRTDVETALAELRDRYGEELEQVLVVAHNAIFDYFILRHRYGQVVRYPFCTRFASYLVHGYQQKAALRDLAELYGLKPKGSLAFMQGVRAASPEQVRELTAYACHDAALTLQLYQKFRPVLRRTPREQAIISHTIRMFAERPFTINAAAVDEGLRELDAHVSGALSGAGYSHEQVSGDKSFAELLSAALAEVGQTLPMKPGKNGPIPALARDDAEMVKLGQSPSAKVRALVELRLLIGSAPQVEKRLQYPQLNT